MIETTCLLLLFYILLAPRVALPFYNTMIFYPHKYPGGQYDVDEIEGVKRQDVFFPSANGKRLHAWLFKHPYSRATILVSHGNAGNLSYRIGLISLLLKAGASVMVYDYQGYGRSEGSPSLAGILEDGRAAYNYLVEQEQLAGESIVQHGESLGSLVASHLAGTVPCGGVILQSGLASFKRIALEALPFLRLYPAWLFPDLKLDNAAMFEKAHPPLLLVHGARDDIIPISHSEEIYARALSPKAFTALPDAGHNDIYEVNADRYQEAVGQLLRFIGRRSPR
jgi:hypothetical protein